MRRLRNWKMDSEIGAPPRARTRSGDAAAMHLDQMTHDGQAETEATILARRCTVRLPESVEDMRQKFRVDSYAGIADGNLNPVSDPLQLRIDVTSRVRELDCVRQEVPDDLLYTVSVTHNHAVPILNFSI